MTIRQPGETGQSTSTFKGGSGWYSRAFGALGLALGLYLTIKYVLPVIAPFVIGVIVASLMEPIVRFLDKHTPLPRAVAAILVLTVSVALLLVVIVATVSGILSELDQLVRFLPRYEADVTHWVSTQARLLKGYYDRLPDPVMGAIDSSGGAVYEKVVAMTKSLLDSLKGIPSLVTTLTVAFIASYFMSRDKDIILGFVADALPKRWRASVRRLRTDVFASTMAYIRAQVILMSLTAVIVILSLLFLHLRYAWLIGIGAGLLDVLPMVGPAAIFVPWIVGLFIIGGQSLAMKLLVVFGIVMAIRQVFEAKIVGESVGVHPLVTLISLYVSVSLFGLTGFLIGPAVVILGRALVKSRLISFSSTK